jgi:hypothetical protein
MIYPNLFSLFFTHQTYRREGVYSIIPLGATLTLLVHYKGKDNNRNYQIFNENKLKIIILFYLDLSKLCCTFVESNLKRYML